jgi:hypothetical protein
MASAPRIDNAVSSAVLGPGPSSTARDHGDLIIHRAQQVATCSEADEIRPTPEVSIFWRPRVKSFLQERHLLFSKFPSLWIGIRAPHCNRSKVIIYLPPSLTCMTPRRRHPAIAWLCLTAQMSFPNRDCGCRHQNIVLANVLH